MAERRSGRSEKLLSATALLDQVEPAHHAITRAMATVRVPGEHYEALERASTAMHRLAAELGHPGRFVGWAPGR